VSKIYQYKGLAGEFKELDQKSRTVAGYFSAFDKVDAYKEVAVKGSFAKTLQENRERIKFFMNHDIALNLGPFQELKEDDYGLFYRATVLPTTFGNDFLIMAEGGVITEHSIGYREEKSKMVGDVKYITEHKLMEGSALTGWGVNQYTPMTSVSKTEQEVTTRIKTLESFIRSTTATDETIQLLMLEIKQLHQALIDATFTTVAVEKTQQPDAGFDWMMVYNSL
jgi:uncharacterized protein